MKFGKLESVDNVDFSLAKLKVVYQPSKKDIAQPLELYLGASGWSHAEWKGTFMPHKTKASEQLNYYAKQCNTIELNTTFYRIPDIELIKKWSNAVSADFKFCPKVLQYISQSRMLGTDTDRIDRFSNHVRYFGKHLGPSFMQLPPHFDSSKFSILERFLEMFPLDLPLSIELRHPSWFTDSNIFEMLVSLLADQKRGLVITDVSGRRDVAHMWVSGPHLIVRFGGNGGHSSDQDRLIKWKNIILQLAENKLKEIYFFSHQSAQSASQAMYNMMYLAQVFSKNQTFITRGPSLIDKPLTLFNDE